MSKNSWKTLVALGIVTATALSPFGKEFIKNMLNEKEKNNLKEWPKEGDKGSIKEWPVKETAKSSGHKWENGSESPNDMEVTFKGKKFNFEKQAKADMEQDKQLPKKPKAPKRTVSRGALAAQVEAAMEARRGRGKS